MTMSIEFVQVEAVSARGLRGISRNTQPRVKRAMEELQEMDATHSKMGFAMQRESDVIASVASVDARQACTVLERANCFFDT